MYYYILKCDIFTTKEAAPTASFFDPLPYSLDDIAEEYFSHHEHNRLPREDKPKRLFHNATPLNKPDIPPTPIDTNKSMLNQILKMKIDFRFGPVYTYSIEPALNKKKKKKEMHNTETELYLGYGVLHLYRDIQPIKEEDLPDTKIAEDESLNITQTSEDDRTIIGILAVPSYMTHKDFIHFLGPDNANIIKYRFIRDYSPNKYTVLLKFKNRHSAYNFYLKYNGRRFNMTAPEISHVVYIRSNSITTVKIEPDTYPYLDETLFADREIALVELPTCPVCLERMDESVTGLLGIQCHHIAQCFCLDKWGEGYCPVCLYSHKPTVEGKRKKMAVKESEVECFECGSIDSLWICMICGHIGCGRYQHAHAYDHYMDIKHLYALEIETQRIWDYAGDGYVHRLIQNTIDGALVELPGINTKMISRSDSNNSLSIQSDRDTPQGKLDAVSFDYTHMLISQLDSQRVYYEEQLEHLIHSKTLLTTQTEIANQDIQLQTAEEDRLYAQKKTLENTLHEKKKDKDRMERKIGQLRDRLGLIQKKLKDENELSKSLIHNNALLRTEAESKDAVIDRLHHQVKDLMVLLEE